jgi:hypothetical protein
MSRPSPLPSQDHLRHFFIYDPETGALTWQARIRVNNRHIYLGVFDSMEEAVRVRKIAEREYGFHPNHGRAA